MPIDYLGNFNMTEGVVDVHQIMNSFVHFTTNKSVFLRFCGKHAPDFTRRFYDIGAIGFGTPIDNTYLSKGENIEILLRQYYKYWTKRFADVGIDLLFPIASISEGGALEIVRSSKICDLVNSCLRGDGISGCGKCWKCFHKNGPLGRDFDIGSREIQIFLRKSPMPTTTHALWALQAMGLEEKTPHLSALLENDYSWWIDFYPPALELLQPDYRDFISNSIQEVLAPMQEPFALENVNHYDE